jgi:hypothetical protein
MVSIISPFAPQHAKYLGEAYQSLLEQTDKDFEWVLVPNMGAEVPGDISADPRCKVFPLEDKPAGEYHNVGMLKRLACEHADGDIIIELDADDILLPAAVERVKQAFADPSIQFAYSNDAYFTDGAWQPFVFSSYYGHKYRDITYKGHELKEHVAFDISPTCLRQIYWSPDHLRAWRKSSYWAVGGHDAGIKLGDDHELMCKFYARYGAAAFKHIDECLYLYRKHEQNSCMVWNGDVVNQSEQNYLRYNREIATRWAKDNKLRLIDLGGRFGKWPEYETIDINPPSDIISDLNERWPLETSSVGVLRASHIFEHLKSPVHAMNEAYRVLAPGGWLYIDVPSTDGRGAFQDPTHVSFWNENSIWYYTDDRFARFIRPEYVGRFQLSRCITWFPGDFERQHNIPIVQADLICLKEPYNSKFCGEKLI